MQEDKDEFIYIPKIGMWLMLAWEQPAQQQNTSKIKCLPIT